MAWGQVMVLGLIAMGAASGAFVGFLFGRAHEARWWIAYLRRARTTSATGGSDGSAK